MIKVIGFIACGFTLAACSASIPGLDFLKSSSPTATLQFKSEPAGALVRASGQTCRTPCKLTLEVAEVSATFALKGYQPQTISAHSESSGSFYPGICPKPGSCRSSASDGVGQAADKSENGGRCRERSAATRRRRSAHRVRKKGQRSLTARPMRADAPQGRCYYGDLGANQFTRQARLFGVGATLVGTHPDFSSIRSGAINLVALCDSRH